MAGSPQEDVLSNEPTLPELKPIYKPRNVEATSSVAGVKRPAASLLPAFEPSSSPSGLPRPLKRQNTGTDNGSTNVGRRQQLPTPVPTSSTGIMSSSPPRRGGFVVQALTAATERAPLGALPSVELSENGEVLMMGRSSNSSHYQLSSNRLVSRVHVKARYLAPINPLEPGKMEIVCNGWNGLKLHSQGRTWELFKGDSFTSETEGTDIMMDVQDARVLIQWPKRGTDAPAHYSDCSWEDSPSEVRKASLLQSSPLRRSTRIESPESPTPAGLSSSQRLQGLFSEREGSSIQIYEDDAEPELPEHKPVDVNASIRTEATESFSSELSEPVDNDENDPDEENDPVIHSFGPFGANISNRLASISTRSPRDLKPSPRVKSSAFKSRQETKLARALFPESHPSEALKPVSEEPQVTLEEAEEAEEEKPKPVVELDPSITNHVANQLAYSRLSSTPLSTIMEKLPSEAKEGLTKPALRQALEATDCIGIIERQGKDAAGKPLESEYYYVPENDTDESRRAAVVNDLRKPSLRACRKQHKQYYWKRPKTP